MQYAPSRQRNANSGSISWHQKNGASAKWVFSIVLLTLLQIGARSASAQDQDFQFVATSGFNYSNGSYGTTRNTNVLIGLAGLGVETGNFKFNVSMPYMRISGRGLVVFDAAGNPIIINRRTSLAPDVRTGFGDLNLSATYAIPAAILDDFEVRLTGSTKIPTASERKRLSTGEADFGLRADISRQFGNWTPFLTVGYLISGKPSAFTLYDTTSVSAGTSVELSEDLVATASYDYDSASTPLVDASHELFGSLSWFLDSRVTLTGYGAVGLTSGSPSFGSGMLVSYIFN